MLILDTCTIIIMCIVILVSINTVIGIVKSKKRSKIIREHEDEFTNMIDTFIMEAVDEGICGNAPEVQKRFKTAVKDFIAKYKQC